MNIPFPNSYSADKIAVPRVGGSVFRKRGEQEKRLWWGVRGVCLRRRLARRTWEASRDRWEGSPITLGLAGVGSFPKCAGKSWRGFKRRVTGPD